MVALSNSSHSVRLLPVAMAMGIMGTRASPEVSRILGNAR